MGVSELEESAGPVLVTVDGAVATVQLNRPAVLNAMSPELMEALAAALETIERGREARAVVIAGHDRAFAAGGDLRAMGEADLHDVLHEAAGPFWARIAQYELPLVAAVSGYAFGGGFELALACDLVVAAETAVFAQPEVGVGIVPGGGGVQRLVRALGRGRALDLLLTGRRIDAHEALALGLVTRVVPAADWRAEAAALAATLAQQPPLAVLLARRAVRAAEELPLGAGLAHDRRLYELSRATDDAREGLAAFRDRRAPRWTGR
jgi:enoyl-CoA hydratase/carnithine racemase